MKIAKWSDEFIEFSDGSKITYDHEQDCCEHNYADFEVLDVFYNGEEFADYRIEPVKYGMNLVLYSAPFAGEPSYAGRTMRRRWPWPTTWVRSIAKSCETTLQERMRRKRCLYAAGP